MAGRDDDATTRAPGPRAGRSGDPGDPPGYAGAAEDARWVEAARAGDERAFGQLFDRWFDPVYDVAWRIVRNRDTAAEVAQDVFLVAWQGLDGLEQPGSFGGWVRRIARNRALNRLDRERRSTPDDEQAAAALDRSAPDVDLSAALGERDQRELVWAAASALGERDASLLDLHLRHGLGAAEIADELGVTTNNAHQLLHRLKGKLGGAIRAWVLWRGARRDCDGLDRAVAAAGITTFGADAVQVIARHVKGCDGCSDRQQLRLSPEALFAGMPIMLAPPLLKAEAAAALGEAGVPMVGSTASGAGDGAAGDGHDTSGADGSGVDSSVIDTAAEADVGTAGIEDGPASDLTQVLDPVRDDAGPVAGGPALASGVAPSDDKRPRRRALLLVGLVALLLGAAGLAASLWGGDGSDPVEAAQDRPTTIQTPTTDAAPPTTSSAPAGEAVGPGAGASPTTATTATTATGGRSTSTTAADAPVVIADPPADEPLTTAPPPSPTTTAPARPVITVFRVTAPGTRCGLTPSEGRFQVGVTWQSTGGTSATLSGGADGTTAHAATDSTTRCAASGDTITLTVTGPGGGSASQSRTVQ